MRGGFQLYKALQQATEPAPARCCSDEPDLSASRARGDGRSAAPMRWVRKLGPAVGIASSAFRSSLRQPVDATPAVGTRVVDPRGETLGHVQDRLIGVESGSTTIAIAATSHAQATPVLLVPDHALRPGTGTDVLVIDRRALERTRAA